MFKFKLKKQLRKMSVFRSRRGWRNDVQQDALINMQDRTAGNRPDEQIERIVPFLLRFQFFRQMDKEEVRFMSQFLVFRRLSDNQTIFRAGGSEKFFLVVHGKVTVSMLVPKSQLATQTLRRLEKRKLEREQQMAAKRAALEAEAAEKKTEGEPKKMATLGVATPGMSSLVKDPLGIAAFLNPATDTKADGPADGEGEGGGGNGGDEGDVEGVEDSDTEDSPADKNDELFDNDPFSLMEVPTKKYYIGDVHRPDIAHTGVKTTATTRAAACGHAEVIMIKRSALRQALESRRVKKNLQAVEMFQPMTNKQVENILSGSETRTWRCGAILMRDGCSVSRCIVLTKGTVQLEWALPNVPCTKRKHGSDYAAALIEASNTIEKTSDEADDVYQANVTKMAKQKVERLRREREKESMHQRSRYVLLTTLLKGDIIGLLEVLHNLKMPYQVRATSVVEGMLMSAEYLNKTLPEKRSADESSSLVLLDSLSRRIEEQVNLLSSHDIIENEESAVTMDHVRKCKNWHTYIANLNMLKKAKGLKNSNQILKKATSVWKKLRNSKAFIGEAKSDRRTSMKINAVDALRRGRILPVKPSKAIGFEQNTVHPDSKSVVVRKLVPKLANKVEKFRHRNQLSATFLTHLDKFAVHKPPKSAAATTGDDGSQTPSFKDTNKPTEQSSILPKL